ncbi:nudix (nucleoside diphosphate linked moiety X)-type motif 8 [Stylosanthes scabra]|uniref:Nudix (Nucleoside diphosphate linked moiety X)-type motif 8 n=1 Tax=Stylosanthes scabra TaxID=79078 RepID=A0ABU6SEA4_9FABA|nr:nudix (nucleoside diphosphate linked moiety X)-type motif 8 [Stylosanthes scabra]
MELKSFSSSEVAVLARSSSDSQNAFSFRHKLGVRFSNSRRGLIVGTYGGPENHDVANKAITSLAGGANNVAAETSFHSSSGLNGSTWSLFTRNLRVLEAFDDEYGGVVIDPDRLPTNPAVFARALHSSLSHWKKMGKKGIWLKLPIEKSDLVPVSVKEGFQYHHAEPGYVMLTYWIPEGPCMLPANASHLVGVGGFVINENNEVLVVQEKHCSPEIHGLWKIPTGFILEAEEIYTGAIREVKEETGIDTEFIEVIAFRHAHNVAFDKSDLFFICMLRALSSKIDVDDHEIEAAKWMPLVDFVKQPLIQEDSMFKKIIDIFVARLGKRYCGLSTHQVVSKFDGRVSSLYYNVIDNNDEDFNCVGD